jgi:hypothetical protein
LDVSESISRFWGYSLAGKFAALEVLAPLVRARRFSNLKMRPACALQPIVRYAANCVSATSV